MNLNFKYFTLFFSLSPVVFYISGYFYYSAYLDVFGLEETYLPLEFSQMLFNSFLPSYQSIGVSFALYISLFLILSLWLIVYFYFIQPKVANMTDFLIRILSAMNLNKEQNKKIILSIDSAMGKYRYVSMYNLLAIFCLISIQLIWSYFLGDTMGSNRLRDYKENNTYQFQLNDKKISIITCSNLTQLCGVYNINSKSIEIDTIAALNGAVLLKDNAKI